MRPVFDFLPDVFGMHDIGFRVGKSGKFFVKPVSAAAFGQFAAQMFINGYQMGNVGKRIFKLFGVQRAQTPIGKAAAFVQLNAENGFDQVFVADRFAEAENLSGRLRVEQRFGNETGLMVNDFDVLAAGMEDFDHFRVVQYGEEGFQFNSGRQRVNDGGCVRRGDLNQAEFGVVRFSRRNSRSTAMKGFRFSS